MDKIDRLYIKALGYKAKENERQNLKASIRETEEYIQYLKEHPDEVGDYSEIYHELERISERW